jgi:transposase
VYSFKRDPVFVAITRGGGSSLSAAGYPSHYRCLIRFFAQYGFSRLWLDILVYVFRLIDVQGEYLILDGTSWKRGSKEYHYLTLCIVYQGISIPIYWLNRYQLGASHTQDRIRLIKKAQRQFDLKNKILLADREYIGEEWLGFLRTAGLDFVIWLKEKTYQKAISQSPVKSYSALKAKIGRSKVAGKVLKKAFSLADHQCYFVVLKNPQNTLQEPFIYLLSSLDWPAKKIAQAYLLRWTIECCFKHLKSNGFQWEQINLQGESRCRLLMAIMIFAYVLSVKEGLRTYQKVLIKKYKNATQQKTISAFRHSLNRLMTLCYSLHTFCQYLDRLAQTKKKAKIPPLLKNV